MRERDIQFFRPLWRRVAVTAVCVIWAALELWHGDQIWVIVTLGLSAYSVWTFFLTFPKAGAAVENKGESNVPPEG